MQAIKKRLLTALVLIPSVVLIMIFASPVVFLLFLCVLFMLAALEWAKLIGWKDLFSRIVYALFLLSFSLWCLLHLHHMLVLYLGFLWWFCALFWIIFYPRYSQWWLNHLLGRSLAGCFVLIPCWMGLVLLRGMGGDEDHGSAMMIVFFFSLIWVADSVAYFVGGRFGKTKLAPHVSPAKSVEGLVAACLSAVVFSAVLILFCQLKVSVQWVVMAILLSCVTVLFSVLGDLFESMMKRYAGVKDSGTLLPGHGGILDRIDSLTASVPVFTLIILFLEAQIRPL